MERFTLSLSAVLWGLMAAFLLFESAGFAITRQPTQQARADQIDATVVEWRWNNVQM